ncbi:unnamed protein product [Rhizophagus irregularis]|nr:unnamed protein product [Rhizophagus irregularis]
MKDILNSFFGFCSIVNGKNKILSDYVHKCSNSRHHDVLEDELKNPPLPSKIYKKIFLQINVNGRKCNDHFTNTYLPGDFEALGDGAVGAVGTVGVIHDQKYIFIENEINKYMSVLFRKYFSYNEQ